MGGAKIRKMVSYSGQGLEWFCDTDQKTHYIHINSTDHRKRVIRLHKKVCSTCKFDNPDFVIRQKEPLCDVPNKDTDGLTKEEWTEKLKEYVKTGPFLQRNIWDA